MGEIFKKKSSSSQTKAFLSALYTFEDSKKRYICLYTSAYMPYGLNISLYIINGIQSRKMAPYY